ncbi:MAG TPA: GPR1/FUN34/YaaH family transporter, partial [Gaiellaceae bacterium]
MPRNTNVVASASAVSGVHPQVRVFVRPYGSPIPLGFFAFGIGMFLYAALDAGWVKPADQQSIGLLLATFVFPLQVIATVFAFLCRDGAAGTALGLFSTSWLAGGVLLAIGTPGELDAAFGYYLVAFAIVIVALAAASIAGRPLLSIFLVVSSARTILGAVYELGGGHGWGVASGWVALATFCVALYAGLAFLLEDTLGRTVFPLARVGAARASIEADLPEQLVALADEAGV